MSIRMRLHSIFLGVWLATFQGAAFATFNFDYEVVTTDGKRTRYSIPERAREFGLSLPISTYRCMIRSNTETVAAREVAWAELWCCADPASMDRCVVSSITCSADADGAGNMTLVDFPKPEKKEDTNEEKKSAEDDKNEPAIDESRARKTMVGFYCMSEGETEATPTPTSTPKPVPTKVPYRRSKY